MAECAKRKMEIFYQDGKMYLECDTPMGKVRLAEMTMSHRTDSVSDAEELLRRWNAFEEGGLVDELRTACEAIVVGLECLRFPDAPPCKKGDSCCVCQAEAALAKS